uniref:Alkyl hydroperoxide reductase subunit C/ Thiol specific antioxidant domain-containing protein n=1 Tax=Oncorhynchus kisutch TaxID=8019 RepID=A0A8C7H083_ONCKI
PPGPYSLSLAISVPLSITPHPSLCSWGILSSHLRDYTAVCTTELGRANKLSCEFSRSNIEMIALSIDSLEDHRGWTKVSAASKMESGCAFLFPIIADSHRKLAVGLAMLDHDEKDKDGIPLTATVDFSIGPDKRLKLSLLYLPTMAWNFDEILRAVDGQQLTAQNQLATPADWQVSQSLSNSDINLHSVQHQLTCHWHSESIHTPSPFPHFVTIQPYSKMD